MEDFCDVDISLARVALNPLNSYQMVVTYDYDLKLEVESATLSEHSFSCHIKAFKKPFE